MSITALPTELIELLFSYLDIKDLLNARTAIGLEGSEQFWKKICEREGLRKGVHDSSWRSVFEKSSAWLTKSFVKRKHEITNEPMSVYDMPEERMLFENYLVLKTKDKNNPEVFMWNIKHNPVMFAQIPADHIIVGGSDKLLAYHGPDVTLYSFSDNSYRVLLTLASSNLSCNLAQHCCLSDDYVIMIDKARESIKVFNLPNSEDYSLAIATENMIVETLSLVDHCLYITTVTRDPSPFYNAISILKRYHLMKKEWFRDVFLYDKYTAYKLQLRVTSNLIVIWCSDKNMTVWITSSEGDIMKSLSSEFFTCIEDPTGGYQFGAQWLSVVDSYIIFAENDSRVTIWCADEPDSCKEIGPHDEDCYRSHAVVSSSLIVIIRHSYFKVLNFHKATYLYAVRFDDVNMGQMANNCFIMYIINQNNRNNRLKKKYDLHLYDFSANNDF